MIIKILSGVFLVGCTTLWGASGERPEFEGVVQRPATYHDEGYKAYLRQQFESCYAERFTEANYPGALKWSNELYAHGIDVGPELRAHIAQVMQFQTLRTEAEKESVDAHRRYTAAYAEYNQAQELLKSLDAQRRTIISDWKQKQAKKAAKERKKNWQPPERDYGY